MYFCWPPAAVPPRCAAWQTTLRRSWQHRGCAPERSEGYRTGDWITLDYGDLLVHIFRREIRAFYDLEHLWADAGRMDIRPYMVQEHE